MDVFGVGPFSGNPLAVVVDAEGLGAEDMARISAWTNFSECTFLLPPTAADADYRVRIFSLRTELPFAGHPTLGSAHAWLASGGRPRREGVVVQQCGAGLVEVRVDGEALAFAAPPLLRSGPVAAVDLARVLAVLGLSQQEVLDSAWVDNGPGWIGLLLRDADAVLALAPDAARDPSPGHLDIGVVGPYADGDIAYEVRAFFSDDDSGALREDPVTGSLNASLAQWLVATGRATPPWTTAQGTRVGRTGRVSVTAVDGRLWVGGRVTTAVTGEIVTG